MKTRICSRCGTELELSAANFNASKRYNEGFRPECKTCHKKWYLGYSKGIRVRIEAGEITEKTCSVCGLTFPVDMFHRRKRFSINRTATCKTCANEQSRQYCKKKETEQPGWLARRGRRRNLKKLYGFSQEQYDVLFKKQNGLCAICGLPWVGRNMHVDHDHITGKIRGLLCGKCNPMLGLADDSVEILTSAIEYIRKNNEEA